MTHFPEIGEIKKTILAAGAVISLMSGSGPTVFGVFADNRKAVACYKKFRQRYGDNVFLTAPRDP
jgi:4-diphosphocytidyl-2-C-methyl-D-erythritol kinase